MKLGTLITASLLVCAVNAQESHSRYTTKQDHDPDGIGVFYQGREIAHVMGHQAADWLDRPERESEEAPSLLVKSLALKSGMKVADIGAGSGYLSFIMAKQVGRSGIVYAEDIQPEMLDIVKKKAAKNGQRNVTPWLGTITDPKLKANSIDLMILVDVYHEFDHPYEMTQNMVRELKPGGRLVFVEYRKEDPEVPIKELHKMSVAQVRKEMTAFALRYMATIESLPRQHIIVFTKELPTKS